MADYQKETDMENPQNCDCEMDPAFGNTGITYCALHGAAPDLLAALKAIAALDSYVFAECSDAEFIMETARAAIAKAKGV